MIEQQSDFERYTGTVRYTEAWARKLARDTAWFLGRDYCVVQGHDDQGEFMAYGRDYVENRMYLGEIGPEQVIACYGADGQEIDREEVRGSILHFRQEIDREEVS